MSIEKSQKDTGMIEYASTHGMESSLFIAISCKICNGSIPTIGMDTFPICNQCLSDLKKIILHQRT